MPISLEQIPAMIEDIKKGLTTKNEAISELDTRLKEIEEAAKAGVDLTARLDNVEKVNKSLKEQIKAMMANNYASLKDIDGNYKGVWQNEKQARAFGLHIIAAMSKNNAQRETATKMLTEMGFGLEKDMSVQGSPLVLPAQFMGIMSALIELYGIYRQDALYWPMARDEAIAPVRTSNMTVYAPGAGTAPTQSNPGFASIALKATKMMTLTAIDSELDEDSAEAIGEVVAQVIAESFAYYEDLCGFYGDGTSTYFGFTGLIPALLGVDGTTSNIKGIHTQATAGAWSAIALDDLLALAGGILDVADDGDCKWYSHRNFYYTVMVKLALAAGGSRASEVTHTGYTQSPMFDARPVRFAQVMPRVKASADHIACLLANLKRAAILGDRRRASIEQSREAYFTTDQIGIRGTQRIGMANNHGVGDTDKAGAVMGLLADIA